MPTQPDLASSVVKKMYDNDLFSQWMGMKVLDCGPGHCSIEMKIRKEMTNGFGIAHGAITYSLADSALAFASNSHGKHSLSIDTQISHLKACKTGDLIRAEAREIQRSRALARYDVEVRNQDNDLVAHFRGTVYVKDIAWEV